MHLQLRDQQLKTIFYIYRLLYHNFGITAKQKSTIDTQTNKKNQLKYNTKDIHQTTRKENTRREEKRATKTNPKQLIGDCVVAQWLTNPTGNHKVVGSIPGTAQWVNKDPALP